MTKSDIQLMLEVQEGNTGAFQALVLRYQGPLINFFFRLSWDRQQSEDCAQEVFCRIFVHRHSYRPQAKFSTYLFKIARNYWIDQQRSRQAQPRVTSLNRPLAAGEGRDFCLLDQVPAPAEPDLGESEQRSTLGVRLREALDELPEQQRLVFVLSETQEMKYSEIAEVLHVPVGTVKSRMHNAVKKLREILIRKMGQQQAQCYAM